MTRNLYEPTDKTDISKNRYKIKDTRQKPFASAWITPIDAGGTIPATEPAWTPTLENSWIQSSSPLEPWAFRLHYSGELQFKGVLDMTGGAAYDTVAVTLPGAITGDPNYLSARDNDESYMTSVTEDGTTVKPATAYVDAATGEVTISPIGSVIEYFTARSLNVAVQSVGLTGQFVQFDWWENGNSSVFTPIGSAGTNPPVLGTHEVRTVRLLQPGRYTILLGSRFETSFDAETQFTMLDQNTFAFHYQVIHGTRVSDDGGGTFNRDELLLFSASLAYPLRSPGFIDPTDPVLEYPDFAGGGYVPISFVIAQNSGANKDLITFGSLLQIHYEPNVNFL